MIRLLAAIAVLYYAGVGVLWALDLLSQASAETLLFRGTAVLGILAVAGFALSAVVGSGKPVERYEEDGPWKS